MWQIRRIYLDAIGTPAGRFADVTLDMADGRGRPLDSILWLRNGGGKSTIMALLGALVRPGRNDFLSAAEHRNDAGRHLEDYVLGSDTAHVAVEWGESDGRRLVTGAVYEWQDRQQPTDPNAQWQRLNQRFYTFLPDGDRAEIARLPFRIAGRPTAQEAFCTAIKALPGPADAVVARQRGEWTQTLASRGIDPDLWRTILQMNESEGGIEHQFLYANADEFVNYLLKLIVDPSIPDDVAKILTQVTAELATRPAVEADLRFCVEAMDRLTELDAAWRTARDASELVRIATADARLLRGSLMLAAEMATAEALEAKEATDASIAEAARHRAASDAARDTGNEYARLAAVLRERAADAQIAAIGVELGTATLDREGWLIAPQVADQFDLAEQRKTLTDALAAAEQDAAPVAARRVETASNYAIALESLAASARRQVAAATTQAAEATAAGEVARTEHTKAVTTLAELEASRRTARAAVERFDGELAAARAADVLGLDEEPAAAVVRLTAADEADATREDELRAAIVESEAAVARDRATRDALSPVVERAKFDAESAARVRDDLVARRDALASEPRLAVYLPSEDADVIGMGRTIRDSIAAGVARAESSVMDLHLDGADDERARHAIEATGLLPPAPDLARARALLDEAHIRAVTGWTYLAEVVREPDRQLAAFLAAPDLASGLLVQDPADLGRARELLADAGLRPTSLVAIGSTRELQDAADAGSPGRPAIPPNVSLFDAERAAEELARREAAASDRALARAQLEAERDLDRELQVRLNALLAECPPERLGELDAEVMRLRDSAQARTVELVALDAAIAGSIEQRAALGADLRATGDRRRVTDRARVRADALVASAVTVARDRETLAGLPALMSAAQDASQAADAAERAAAATATTARLRAASLQTQLDGYAALRAALPEDLPTDDTSLDDGWSLDGLATAWQTADESWTLATSGSPVAQDLASVTKREQRIRETLAAKPDEIVAHAKALLATPDGATDTTREHAAQAAAEEVKRLTLMQGELTHEKSEASREAEKWEAGRDRQRHRVVDEPASVEEAKRLEVACRAEQESEATARTTADDVARREEKRAADAAVRADAFADQAGRIIVPDEDGATVADTAFAGSVEEARRKAAEVSASLTALRSDEERDRRKLETAGNAITVWAGQDEWAAVKADVRSRFRTADVANELGPIAAKFRDEEIDLRRIEIAEHLRTLDEARSNVIGHAVGMIRQALRSIAKFSNLSKLPPDLGDWSGEKLIDVGPRTPVDDKDEAVMRDRVGRAVDSLITGQTATVAGMDLLWRALREVVGPTGFRARVMKPSPSFSVERVPVERMRKWSGGEKVTMALLLFVTIAKLRASNRGRDMAGAGALVLDNPLGKASYAPFLALQRRVAHSAGIQLVFLTGVADMRAVAQFPCVVRMRNAPDTARRRGYVQVTGRDIRDESEIARVDATRVYRLDDEPTLTLA
jgi:hypothetical protein